MAAAGFDGLAAVCYIDVGPGRANHGNTNYTAHLDPDTAPISSVITAGLARPFCAAQLHCALRR